MNTTSPHLIKLFFELTRKLKELLKTNSSEASISVLQIHALRFIAAEKNPTMKDVAVHFLITPASATSLINSLANGELVQRLPDAVDRRIVKLTVTEKGTAKLAEMKGKIEEQLDIFLRKLSKEEQESLCVIFEKLLQ